MTITNSDLTPEQQAEQDRLANDDLYKEFLKRETESTTPEGATTEDTEEDDTTGGKGSGPVGEGGAAPTLETQGQTTSEDDDETTDTTTGLTTTDTTDDETTDHEGFEYAGRSFSGEDTAKVVALFDWASNLPDDAAYMIDAVLSGDYVLVPKSTQPTGPTPRNPAWQPIGTSDGTTTPTPSDTTADDELLDLDPAVRNHLQRLEGQVSQLTEAQQVTLESQRRTEHQQLLAAVETGTEEFRTTYDLSSEEAKVLQNRVVQLQILPSYAAQNPGNPAAAMKAAMDSVYWSDPKWRQREIDRQLAKERDTKKIEDKKKTKVSSLTSGGGSLPRTEAPVNTKEGRKEAMVGELKKVLNQE